MTKLLPKNEVEMGLLLLWNSACPVPKTSIYSCLFAPADHFMFSQGKKTIGDHLDFPCHRQAPGQLYDLADGNALQLAMYYYGNRFNDHSNRF